MNFSSPTLASSTVAVISRKSNVQQATIHPWPESVINDVASMNLLLGSIYRECHTRDPGHVPVSPSVTTPPRPPSQDKGFVRKHDAGLANHQLGCSPLLNLALGNSSACHECRQLMRWHSFPMSSHHRPSARKVRCVDGFNELDVRRLWSAMFLGNDDDQNLRQMHFFHATRSSMPPSLKSYTVLEFTEQGSGYRQCLSGLWKDLEKDEKGQKSSPSFTKSPPTSSLNTQHVLHTGLIALNIFKYLRRGRPQTISTIPLFAEPPPFP